MSLTLQLNVNGQLYTVQAAPDEMLLTTLRNLGLYSVRCGCDTTNCGLCTIWVDGEIVLSCAYLTVRAQGHTITTLEGLKEEAAFLGECLASEGADQCGYCTTGMMMSVMALRRKKAHPTDQEIKDFLVGNLCRCTGYQSQLRGIRKYLEAMAQ